MSFYSVYIRQCQWTTTHSCTIYVANLLLKYNFLLCHLRSVHRRLGKDITEWFVYALVLSMLDYCNVVLAGLPASTLAPLQRVLHMAARVLLDLKPWDHISSSLQQLHWLPIDERITYKLYLLIHDAAVGRALAYITDLFQPAVTTSSWSLFRAASHGDYIVPRTNRRLTDRAFSTAAPWVWNQLPTYLEMTQLTSAFHRGLKQDLF